ncbi:MAG TPA: hypothetical protein VFT74_08275, partial [Isosphaeraceae bacterium]|nr:hypothetical protein [Isosphaeraceae bacterium]
TENRLQFADPGLQDGECRSRHRRTTSDPGVFLQASLPTVSRQAGSDKPDYQNAKVTPELPLARSPKALDSSSRVSSKIEEEFLSEIVGVFESL